MQYIAYFCFKIIQKQHQTKNANSQQRPTYLTKSSEADEQDTGSAPESNTSPNLVAGPQDNIINAEDPRLNETYIKKYTQTTESKDISDNSLESIDPSTKPPPDSPLIGSGNQINEIQITIFEDILHQTERKTIG